jgi:hypothetical protein
MADLDHEIDHLYTLPLAEFTPARNSLASTLKRAGKAKDSERVKSLLKPSASAWAVNQLFWKHHKDFDRLMKAGEEFRQAQADQLAGKSSDARKSGELRQNAIVALSRIAAELLQAAGHSASPDVMRRIATTLEALSAYASIPGAPTPERLTEDVEAPGFDAVSALFSGHMPKPVRVQPRESEKDRSSEIPAAKAALREAQRVLQEAEAKARHVEAQLKKAAEELEQAEKRRAEADERFRKISREAKDAASAVDSAKREVERAEKKRDAI